tara:strand:- start:1445 stop:2314 length:870 start_codon:yes stop_codon:yes gene_type:complete
VKLQNYKNLFNGLNKKIKEFDLNSFLEDLKNINIDDLKNINYRRLFYDIQNSQYLKPTIGIFSASLLTIFVFIPSIESVSSSLKKAKKYQYESKDLPNKISELKNKSLKFSEIKIKMAEINSSFIRNQQIIFITKLLNETAKKTNVKINSFSPIFRPESSKLCKVSTYQKNSKNFKSSKKKPKLQKKGLLKDNYFEVTFQSDYLDIIQFLKKIQLYDVNVIPICLEVNSQKKSTDTFSEKDEEYDSLIIPLSKAGEPLISKDEVNKINISPELGIVETKVVLKIPSFNK